MTCSNNKRKASNTSSLATFYLNPDLFFLIGNQGQGIVAWDYRSNSQYEIESDYFLRMLDVQQKPVPVDSVSKDLAEANLISKTPFPVDDWGWDVLSKIYHVGTKNPPVGHNTENYQEHFSHYIDFSYAATKTAPEALTERGGLAYALPKPNLKALEEACFWDTVYNRKTCRDFYEDSPLSQVQLSTLLYVSFGYIHKSWPDLEDRKVEPYAMRKSSPSVGGLNCCEAYVIALNVTGLEQGVYHYCSHQHKLSEINIRNYSGDINELLKGQSFAVNLSFITVITARLEKCWHKYGHSRAYSAVLIDAGHISQTFHLTASALKLQSWLTGIFSNEKIERMLGIAETTEVPLFIVGAGVGSGDSLSKQMQKIILDSRK